MDIDRQVIISEICRSPQIGEHADLGNRLASTLRLELEKESTATLIGFARDLGIKLEPAVVSVSNHPKTSVQPVLFLAPSFGP